MFTPHFGARDRSLESVHYGSFAMNVMRLEKAFKSASELSNEVTLPEAGMMRFVRLSKNDFIGKDATRKKCGIRAAMGLRLSVNRA